MFKKRYLNLFLASLVLVSCIDTAHTKEIHPAPYQYVSEVASWILNDEFVICDDCPGETVEQDKSDMSDSLFLTDDEAVIDEEPLFDKKNAL